jgi:hypothetical protein
VGKVDDQQVVGWVVSGEIAYPSGGTLNAISIQVERNGEYEVRSPWVMGYECSGEPISQLAQHFYHYTVGESTIFLCQYDAEIQEFQMKVWFTWIEGEEGNLIANGIPVDGGERRGFRFSVDRGEVHASTFHLIEPETAPIPQFVYLPMVLRN